MPSAQIGYNLTNTLPEAEYQASGKGFNVLDTTTDHLGRVWVYVHANGAITGAGFFVTIDEAGEAVMLTTTNAARGDRVGVAPYAFADNDYGWVQVYGVCDSMQVLASAAANISLQSTATPGAIDDPATASTKVIDGAFLTTARAASQGNAPGMLNFPAVGATL